MTIQLNGIRVGLSGAIPSAERSGPPATWKELDIRMTVSRLTHRIVAGGGRLLHGTHPTLVPVIETAATTAAKSEGSRPVDQPVSYFVVLAFQEDYQFDEFFERRHHSYARVRSFGERSSNPNETLAEMRRAMIDECDVLVCVGGELHLDGRRLPGVGVEAQMAAARGLPVLVAGAAGGFASRLLNEHPMVRDALRKSRLSERNAEELVASAGPARAVSLIMTSLCRLAQSRT